MNNKEIIKKTLLSTLPNLTIMGIILVLVWLFKLSFAIILVIILSINLAKQLYYAHQKGWEVQGWGKKVLLTSCSLVLFLTFIYYLTAYLGGWGILGVIIVGVVIALYILIKNFKQYMFWVRHIETQIFGKPLDKKKKKNGDL